MAGRAEPREVGARRVAITRPQKVLFPEAGITKADLVAYYRRIARWMLPHLRGRPIAMERYPDGIDEPGFFQKSVPAYFPGWIRTVTVKKAGGTVKHVVCDDVATLTYLAGQACVTPHIWLSPIDDLGAPDQMVFDLDPSVDRFESVKSAARSLKDVLDDLELPAYLKTTGSRGLHVAVPLQGTEDFESVRALARAVARIVVGRSPGEWTLEERKARRRGRAFIDTNRNGYAQTVAPAYAVRARSGAPVSTPLEWRELGRTLRPDGVTISSIFGRLERRGDPWADFARHGVSLRRARAKLEELDAP